MVKGIRMIRFFKFNFQLCTKCGLEILTSQIKKWVEIAVSNYWHCMRYKTVKFFFFFFMILSGFKSMANTLLIPMDESQKNHLKAYGIAYWTLNKDIEVDWLLNYRGGSFACVALPAIENECVIRGISYEVISDPAYGQIQNQIQAADVNMEIMHLQKPPKIAVYSPKSKLPWDDAVTLVLTYAEIPYTVVFDTEIMDGLLAKYDWLHLHHEDFTGQYGKFFSYAQRDWYKKQVAEYEAVARKYGFNKVSQLKLSVVKKMREYVAGGGFLFAMCSATDTYDIALSADGLDIVGEFYDGDAQDFNAQNKLNYSNCFAFRNFKVSQNQFEYEYSNIDNDPVERGLTEKNDYFKLFQFSAKWDPVPCMLTQNHTQTIKGFMGQTTGFKSKLVKPEVLVMGENKSIGETKYIHGTVGKGTWTFYGGHDPEDYQHQVEEEPTDLKLHPNSPGYRLILNNILFPAAKKKKMKT